MRALAVTSLFVFWISPAIALAQVKPTPPTIPHIDWHEPHLNNAQRMFHKQRWRASAALFSNTLLRIQRDVSLDFKRAHLKKVGPRSKSGPLQATMSRYTSGEHPILIVAKDRFFFSPHLTRMMAWALFRSEQPQAALDAYRTLLSSSLGNKNDHNNINAIELYLTPR